jgi:hypothetical protein
VKLKIKNKLMKAVAQLTSSVFILQIHLLTAILGMMHTDVPPIPLMQYPWFQLSVVYCGPKNEFEN